MVSTQNVYPGLVLLHDMRLFWCHLQQFLYVCLECSGLFSGANGFLGWRRFLPHYMSDCLILRLPWCISYPPLLPELSKQDRWLFICNLLIFARFLYFKCKGILFFPLFDRTTGCSKLINNTTIENELKSFVQNFWWYFSLIKNNCFTCISL